LAKGVCAGTIESSNGNAKDAPTPRRMVLRERCFLVMNMLFLFSYLMVHQRIWRGGPGDGIGGRFGAFGPAHLERHAFDDSQDER